MTIGLTLGATSLEARAEYPPTCRDAWWMPADEADIAIDDVPPDAGVYLPIVWANEGGWPAGGARVDADALVVTVVDPAGDAVAGQVGSGVDPSVVDLAGPSGKRAWWRPSAPLSSGRYVAQVSVRAPPVRGECHYVAFDDSRTFDVADAPSPDPEVELTLSLGLMPDQGLVVHGIDCDEHTPMTMCPDLGGTVAACCYYADGVGYQLDTSIALTHLRYGHALGYYAVEVARDRLVAPYAREVAVLYPDASGAPLQVDDSGIVLASDPLPPALCTKVTLVELLTGRALASHERCVDTALELPTGPRPAPICNYPACFALTHPPQHPELDATSDAPDLEDAATPRSSGCAGGATSSAVAWLALGLVRCACRERRRRDPA
ncbi:MAG: hypothetical protein U1F43_35990 [Myxococcota bacterium]